MSTYPVLVTGAGVAGSLLLTIFSFCSSSFTCPSVIWKKGLCRLENDEVMLNVLRCQLTYQGQAVTNAEAWLNIALRPRKPEDSLDGQLRTTTSTLTQLLNYDMRSMMMMS